VTAPLAGECARCLEEFTSSIRVRLQELYTWDDDPDGDDSDGYQMHGDLLDLEPALRDALVLELPLSPLCSQDCAGLCASAAPGWRTRTKRAHAAQHMTTPDGAAVPELRKEP
jgi:Predicted metal-binding, possibly nucleic acid-binding protein